MGVGADAYPSSILVIPAKAGIHRADVPRIRISMDSRLRGNDERGGWRLLQRLKPQVFGQIAPLGVGLNNQPDLPRAVPLLDALLPLDGRLHRPVLLEPHQSLWRHSRA